MFKLGKDVQLAVLLLTELKAAPANTPVKLETISKKHTESLHFLEQVARKLRVAGLISAVRGPGGGYVLKVTHLDLLKLHDVLGKTKGLTPPIQVCEKFETMLKRTMLNLEVLQ